MARHKILATIVTYNPDYNRLIKNIDSIAEQVDHILIVDNSSADKIFLENLGAEATIIVNDANLGVAGALNQAFRYAIQNGFEWVVTLDQDSIVPKGYVDTALQIMDSCYVGQIVPVLFEDRTHEYCLLGDDKNEQRFQLVRRSITSAAINRVEAWKKCGGYNEELFVDYVDFDYALRLKKNGYSIIRINSMVLQHQMGNSFVKNVGFLKIRVPNYSADRKYGIAKNIVMFVKSHGTKAKPVIEVLRLGKLLSFTIAFEDDKLKKTKAIIKGIQDGIKNKAKNQDFTGDVML